ncbi:MAG: hypothetical protein QOD82_7141, partial [Pseudonocardiales bacterium]|nr:hypothetical protein [Pseudonocardiales bacterium]
MIASVASTGGRCVRAVLPVVSRVLSRLPLSGMVVGAALVWMAAALFSTSPAGASVAVAESPAVHLVAQVRQSGSPAGGLLSAAADGSGALSSCADGSAGTSGSCDSPAVVGVRAAASGPGSSGGSGYVASSRTHTSSGSSAGSPSDSGFLDWLRNLLGVSGGSGSSGAGASGGAGGHAVGVAPPSAATSGGVAAARPGATGRPDGHPGQSPDGRMAAATVGKLAGKVAATVTDKVTGELAAGMAEGADRQNAAKLVSQTAARLVGADGAGRSAAAVADRVGAATGGWVEQLLDRVLSGVGKLVGSLGSMNGNSGQSGTGTASGTGQTSTVAQGQNGSVGQPAAQEANAGRMSALRAAIDDPSTAADVSPAELAQAGVSGADVAKLLAAAGQPSQQRSRSNSSSSPAGLSGAGLSGPSVEQLLSGAVDLVSGVVTTVGGRAAGQRTHAALTQVTDQVESALAASAALNNGTNGAGLGGVAGGRQPAVAGSRPERDAGPTTTSRPRGDGDSGAVAELVSRVTGCATAGAPGCVDDVVGPLSRFVESLSGRGPPAAASTDTSTSSGQTDRGSSNSAGSSSTQALSDQVESAKSQLSPAIAKLIDNIVSSATRMAAQAKSAAATPQRGSRLSSTTVLPGSTDTGSGGWVGQLVDQLMSGLGELTPQLTEGQRSGPARQLTSAAAAPTAAAQDAGPGPGQLGGGLVRFIGNVLAEVGQFLGQLGTQPGTTGPGGNPTGSQGSDNQGSGNQGSGGAGQSSGGSGQPGPSVDQLAQGITQLVQSWLAQNGLTGSDGSAAGGSSADQGGSVSGSDAESGHRHGRWDDSGDSDDS